MSKEYSLNVEQAQFLFSRSINFHLPDKLGDGDRAQKFSPQERMAAREDVGCLFRELRAYSPRAQKFGRDAQMVYGEPGWWEEETRPDGNGGKVPGLTMRHGIAETMIKIRLSEEAVGGAMWLMFLLLHPSVDALNTYQTQILAWPIVRAFNREHSLREALGMNGCGRRWGEDEEAK
jgi:hypothetical protein